MPSTKEQTRIAEILSAFDEKIENNNRIIKTLEEMAQAIFKEWFVDFRFPRLPACVRSAGRRITRGQADHEKAEFVDLELGRIPKGWETRNLFDALSVTYGYPFKSSLFNSEGHGVPVIRIRNILESKTSTSTTEEITDEKYL